jgi:hypothetical protein
MELETLLEEFAKRGIFLERGIGIKYTREYNFFSCVSSGNVSYTTADGWNEVIFHIYNNSVEDINVSGPRARHIEDVYKEIEAEFFNTRPRRVFGIF